MGVDPLAAARADAKIRVYELLKKAAKKTENKEQYRGWALVIRDEWFMTLQEFGDAGH